jgi:hypothetical protein
VAWLTGVLALITFAQTPDASCIAGLPRSYHFDVSTVVFLGEAIEQTAVDALHGDGFRTTTTFKVERQWKGPRAERIEVRTCSGSGGPCSEPFKFRVGMKYVVFAFDRPFKTTGCNLTRTLEEADATIAWLDDPANVR